MYHLWDLCICVYAIVCVCPSLAWLASFRLERMDHTDGWQNSMIAWLPPFLLLSSAHYLVTNTSSLVSVFHFFLYSLPVFPILTILSPPSFFFLPPSFYTRPPVVDGRFGCHPLSTFPHKPCSASFRLPPEIIHCCWPLTKTTWPLWGLQIKKWNMDPVYSFIDFTGCSTARWLTHMYTHKHRLADSTQTLWARWKGGFWTSSKDTFILTHPMIINQTKELRGHDVTPNF